MNGKVAHRTLRQVLKNWDTYAVILLVLIFGVGGDHWRAFAMGHIWNATRASAVARWMNENVIRWQA